jgi:hypothetical protein
MSFAGCCAVTCCCVLQERGLQLANRRACAALPLPVRRHQAQRSAQHTRAGGQQHRLWRLRSRSRTGQPLCQQLWSTCCCAAAELRVWCSGTSSCRRLWCSSTSSKQGLHKPQPLSRVQRSAVRVRLCRQRCCGRLWPAAAASAGAICACCVYSACCWCWRVWRSSWLWQQHRLWSNRVWQLRTATAAAAVVPAGV